MVAVAEAAGPQRPGQPAGPVLELRRSRDVSPVPPMMIAGASGVRSACQLGVIGVVGWSATLVTIAGISKSGKVTLLARMAFPAACPGRDTIAW